jgi:hypothetical protein
VDPRDEPERAHHVEYARHCGHEYV